jgi:Xaa-Pro aminopeptidase
MTCFSIEPGIYLPGDFGVRSEINVVLLPPAAEAPETAESPETPESAAVEVTGGPAQRELLRLL